jgi:hypothetical protein
MSASSPRSIAAVKPDPAALEFAHARGLHQAHRGAASAQAQPLTRRHRYDHGADRGLLDDSISG